MLSCQNEQLYEKCEECMQVVPAPMFASVYVHACSVLHVIILFNSKFQLHQYSFYKNLIIFLNFFFTEEVTVKEVIQQGMYQNFQNRFWNWDSPISITAQVQQVLVSLSKLLFSE